MADGLNQKINDHDSISTILSSDNFLNLDTNIQNRIIDTVHTDKEKDGGNYGKISRDQLFKRSYAHSPYNMWPTAIDNYYRYVSLILHQ